MFSAKDSERYEFFMGRDEENKEEDESLISSFLKEHGPFLTMLLAVLGAIMLVVMRLRRF
ncbi:hypothetical protein BU23DRAFT_557810 [Bimuria novae-zelandiae CBS 107.79]|uniref:Uncharacterized protein n=1 Tax=Bimuria novae-zelandiae CBS 107.79 TaxID=1447943 RepID=A0A6A5UWZ5_9PLEO|nr:hypothetical protein BU23DRAFT_557810 [Bimuria novae-zelandiae CBS 107.79]